MPAKKLLLTAWALLAWAALVGCKDGRPMTWNEMFPKEPAVVADPTPPGPAEPIVFPPHIAGTVGEFARLVGGGDLPVEGYGLVLNLGTNGSREVPPRLRQYLADELAKHKFGRKKENLADLTPDRIIKDLDTAVVRVMGVIPPGMPKGGKFDLAVMAVEGTSTKSLAGGSLMPLDLHLSLGEVSILTARSKPLGGGVGEVFINPFLDPKRGADLAKFRRGRVLSGGSVVEARPILLRLRRPDYALCDLIQRKINGRFPYAGVQVATGRNKQIIEIKIPPRYRDTYEHFLSLILHLPIRTGGGTGEVNAQKIAQAMELPNARHEELALVWEATGRQVMPAISPLYTSKNPLVAFYSARTGLRFGDDLAADVIIRLAETAQSPLQIPAITELGRHSRIARAAITLERLLNDENALVQVAAYQALRDRGDSKKITSYDVGGKFQLDVVQCRRNYVIYAMQSGQPRIVLFGLNMPVARPIFFLSPGETVQVNANRATELLHVRCKVARTNTTTDPAEIEPRVAALVRVLGALPSVEETDVKVDTSKHPIGEALAARSPLPSGTPEVFRRQRRATGLGLTYGQVVAVLQHMCKDRCIPARFVLQESKSDERIYNSGVTSGRSDMPGS